MTPKKSFGQETRILSEREGELEKVVDEIKELPTLEAIVALDIYTQTRTLQIAEKAVGEAKLNRLGYPDDIADRIARLAVDDMERDILSRIKSEIGGE